MTTQHIEPGHHVNMSPLPDLPGIVHGLKQVGEVWATQCDQCLLVVASKTKIIPCMSITFDARKDPNGSPTLRLCAPCWSELEGLTA